MLRVTLTAATLLASVSFAATAAARPMTPEDVAKLEAVGSVAVSPDGTRVAVTSGKLPDVTAGEDNGSTRSTRSQPIGSVSLIGFLSARQAWA